jgi:hypothetical protein
MRILKSLALTMSVAATAFAILPETRQAGSAVGPILELDGVYCGDLSKSDLVQVPGNLSELVDFHPTGMTDTLFKQWLSPFIAGQPAPRNVGVLQVAVGGVVRSSAEFLSILPQELDLPVLDAASKDLLVWSLRFSAPTARLTTPSGKIHKPPTSKPVSALASNFRVAIDGIDTSRVSKVEAITLKQRAGASSKEVRQPTKGNGPLVSNLVIHIATGFEQPFRTWMTTAAKVAKNGSITFLKPNLATPWGTLTFRGLTIAKIEAVSTSTSDRIQKTRIEMAVESAQFTYQP